MKRIEVDPVAEKFPDLPKSEFKELVASIKQDGLNEPVVLLKGKCIEGRHRLAACYEAGVEPTTVVYHGDESPEGIARYVWAANGLRRHLTAGQRALIVAELFPPKVSAPGAESSAEKAKIAGVSERTMDTAEAVAVNGKPEVKEAVKAGKISLKEAEKKTKPQRDKPPKSGKQKNDPRAKQTFEDAFGKLKRATDDLNKAFPAEKFCRQVQSKLNEAFEIYKEWRRAVR